MYSKNQPLVAIHCLVYNHEDFLRDCFEGFVMQQTNFTFVAIVHDDASTDKSVDIIREYEVKYPHIFKPIYESENQFSKCDGTLERIMNDAIEATGAKYVAMCEGDDFWTDPYKLQTQVDFMEENEEYSICFHRVSTLIQATGELKDELLVRNLPQKSTIMDLACGNYIHTPTVLYRNKCFDKERYYDIIPCLPGDYVVWMLLAENGDIYKIDQPMATYRYGVGIWSSNVSIMNSLATLQTLMKLHFVIKKTEVKSILLGEIQKQTSAIVRWLEDVEKQNNQIRSSYAYRLGKFLLKPFMFFRCNAKK